MKKLFTLLLMSGFLSLSMTSFGQCDPPTGLSAVYNNNVSTFTWDAVPGAIEYEIQFKYPVYSWLNNEYETVTSTNSLTLTGIIQSSTFDWRVRANCGSGYSPYTESQFTLPCPSPSALTVTNITNTSVIVNWTPAPGLNTNISDFAIAYRIANSNGAWISAGRTFSSSSTITGLTPGTSYEYCVNQTCTYFNSNPVIGQFTTTSTGCGTPAGLNVLNITATNATVSWSGVSLSSTYTVQYKKATSNSWTTVNTNATSLLLTGLTASTQYNWKVMANCNGSTSGYSISQFTTAACPSYGNNNSEWIDFFKLGSINRSSGAESGGYVNTGLSTALVIGSVANSGQISAGFSGNVRNQKFNIYIDLNGNGSYNDPGELIINGGSINSAGTINFSINIPGTAVAGSTMMRIMMRRTSAVSSPCMTGFNGETEDYLVNLVTSSLRGTGSGSEVVTVENSKVDKITVSPNPSNGIFNVTLPRTIEPLYYEVLNLSGAIVKKQMLSNKAVFQVEIQNMPKGIYMLRITDKFQKQLTHKLVLN